MALSDIPPQTWKGLCKGRAQKVKLPVGSPSVETPRFQRVRGQGPWELSVGSICRPPLPLQKSHLPGDAGNSEGGETEHVLSCLSSQKRDEAQFPR